jgi:LL-H family phage holin
MNLLEIAQPYLYAIATALISLLAAVVLAFIARLRTQVEAWLVARTSAAQRELLHKLAAEAYAYAERQYGGQEGQVKLDAAVQYVLQRLHMDEIGMTSKDVTAAIQKAWAELDGKNRGAA